MTTSPPTHSPFEPKEDERIPLGMFGYFEARNKGAVYELVIKEFLRAGISKADLAKRLGKTDPQVNRLLAAPGNWTLNTLSNLLLAISGGQPLYAVDFPLRATPLNDRGQSWFERTDEGALGQVGAITVQFSTTSGTASVPMTSHQHMSFSLVTDDR